MSDYCREKVLRYPVEESPWDIEEKFPNLFTAHKKLPSFDTAPTDGNFIDYKLEHTYGVDCGDWGRNRELYQEEKDKYRPIFEQIFPNIDMNKVRLVEYCWYNCCEAPDYYDDVNEKDGFYKPV